MATALVDLYGSGSEQFDQLVLPEGYRPTEDEDFMGVQQRAYFLQKLKDWKESIIEESRATMAQLRSIPFASRILPIVHRAKPTGRSSFAPVTASAS
jgi:hypothetical protein